MSDDIGPEVLASASSYTVVLRCRSSARFLPEQGQIVTLMGVPNLIGQAEIRLRTRWLDQGHDAPIPRELWIEVRCRAASLENAMSASTAVSRYLTSVMAFTANVRCGAPEVHLAYDSTEGHREREFVEIFLPDEQGLPREGRHIDTDEFTAVFTRLDQAGHAGPRLSRALVQYELALRYWYFGGEHLALSHLYMAVEALTKLVVRRACAQVGIDEVELARRNGIDPSDPKRPRWRPALDAWARATLIFASDKETYDAARTASDGVEHGFMEMSEVIKRAVSATEATFGYVRAAILSLLELEDSDYPELHSRPPRDVRSLRKMIRGHLLGEGDDLAPDGEEYPYLEWRSNVRTLTRSGNEFKLTFNEKFTLRSHPSISFRGLAFEARGRLEAGQDPMKVEVGQDVELTNGTDELGPDEISAALERGASFASALGKSVGGTGFSPVQALSVLRYSMQLATFEAAQTLLQADRAPEALVLMHGFIRNTCLLQLSATEGSGPGVAIQARLDALERSAALYNDPVARQRADLERQSLERAAASVGVTLPFEIPELSVAPFYIAHAADAAFVNEVVLADDVAIGLHLDVADGNLAFRTQSTDSQLRAGTSSLVLYGLVASAVALGQICDFDYDRQEVGELLDLAQRLDPDSEATG